MGGSASTTQPVSPTAAIKGRKASPVRGRAPGASWGNSFRERLGRNEPQHRRRARPGAINHARGLIMSRSLGTLQREILDALNEAHEADFIARDYRTVYDLSAVKRTLVARGQGRLCRMFVPEIPEWVVWRSGAFEASFSRAVRTLIARGVLRKEVSPDLAASWPHRYFVSRHTDHDIRMNYQCYLERQHAMYERNLARVRQSPKR
jgi:hypothetical protein